MPLRRRTKIRAIQVAIVVGFFAGLQAVMDLGWISGLILSAPTRIAARLAKDVGENELWQSFGTTAFELVAAMLISLTLGSALGFALYRYKTFSKSMEPILLAAYSAPTILLYPMFLTFFGQSSLTVISMAAVLGTVPIAINIAVGLNGVEPLLHKLGRSLNASPRQQYLRILVPAAAPAIFTGFRLGLTYALVGVIGVEFLTSSGGLGKLVSWRYFYFDSEGVFAAIALIALFAIAVNIALNYGEQRIRDRWI
jgi:NitT/TauT family transport system permease protein